MNDLLQKASTIAYGRYQTAIVRIGIAGTWLFFLLREWPNRHELYGPRGPLGFEMAETQFAASDAFSVLMWSSSDLWFELSYHFAIAAAVMLLLGWRTRTAAVLFMIGLLSVQNRNSIVGDGGDNVMHLMSIYLVGTRCGRVWSLDSRRPETGRDVVGVALWAVLGAALAAATALGLLSLGWTVVFWLLLLAHAAAYAVRQHGSAEPAAVTERLGNVLHNGSLVVIVGQLCLLYASAGWYKIQGLRWQDGTAAYYPMQVDAFTPWPELSQLVSSYGLPILLMTYGTVIVQVAFPFSLFNRRAKNVLLALLIAEHAGIAVLLGLPFFSLAVIAADLVFLPTAFLLRIERAAVAAARRVVRRRGAARRAPASDEEPALATVSS